MTKTPLLLVPGLLCSHRLFTAQTGVFGETTDVTVADHTAGQTIADVARSVLGSAPERFALAGLSMGGYVALEILRQQPERVDRLALLDTQARADTEEIIADRRRLLEFAAQNGVVEVQRALLPKLIRQDRIGEEPLTSEVLAMAQDIGEDGFRHQISAIMGRPDSRDTLRTVNCPTLIVVGADDILTPVERSREMAELVSGSRLEIIPRCGHLSTMETPDAVNTLLASWLQS